MSRLLILMVFLFAVPPAGAAQKGTPLTHMSISVADCQKLIQDKERNGARNDVTFKPGVDVNGKPVVSAEGNFTKSALKSPNEIVIDFGLDLAGRYGIGGAGLYKVTAGILTVHYDRDTHKLTFNGKSLVHGDAQAVTKACEALKGTKKSKSSAR